MINPLGNYRYCPLCATTLMPREEGLRQRLACPSCGFVYYHNPVPAAGGVILRDDRVCLVRRSIEPRLGDWTLPAGFIEYDETPSACAEREIEEETGLQVKTEGVLGVYAGFDDPRHHAVLIVYRMHELEQRPLVAGDDADRAEFFAPGQVPENIAFRAHHQALRDLYGERYEGLRAHG
jgi:8-oxo-dGTP diphosphatase